MIWSALIAYAHFLAAFVLVSSLVFQRVTFTRHMSLAMAVTIRRSDLMYALSALTVFIAGFMRVVYFEKGAVYYFSSNFFYVKLTLFVLVGVLSIYPTRKYAEYARDAASSGAVTVSVDEHGLIRRILNLELVLLAVLILSASLMARGIFH